MNVSRRRYMGGEVLPSGAKRIEYLESTGSEYIDLGFRDFGTEWYMTAQRTDSVVTGNGILISLTDEIGRWFGNIHGAGDKWGGGTISGAYTTINSAVKSNIYIKYEQNMLSGTVGNESFVRTASAAINKNYTLFAVKYTSSLSAPIKAKVWSVQCYLNGVKKLDLIPVRIGQVGYLYDLVNGDFYGNLWTGAFILGPDV